MDGSDRCRQQRDNESKRLRAFLKVGLLVSAGLHGVGLTLLLIHSKSVLNRSPEVPVEIVTLNSPGIPVPSPSSAAATGSEATPPAPLKYFPSPSRSGGASALASSPPPSSPSLPQAPSTSSDRPTQETTAQNPPAIPSEQTTAEQATAAQLPSPSLTDISSPTKSPSNPTENSQPNPPAPSVISPAATASAGSGTQSTTAGNNFLQMLRDRLSHAIGTAGSSSGNVAGGTGGQMGLSGARNNQPSPSLGLGASSLGGLASRNLENGMATFFANTGKVERPECLICSKPVYPERAQRSGITGDVLVGYDLDRNGRVIGTHLLRSSGNAELDRASLAEARNHRFKPMTNGYNDFVARFSYRKGGTSSSLSVSPRPAATTASPLLPALPKPNRPADGQTPVHELLPEPTSAAAIPAAAPEPPIPARSPASPFPESPYTPGVATLEKERALAPTTNLEFSNNTDSASPRSNPQ